MADVIGVLHVTVANDVKNLTEQGSEADRRRITPPSSMQEFHTTYSKLKGADHDLRGSRSTDIAFFDYAARFANAFRHAVTLCGGKAAPF
jgi:hypothetical protein